MDVRIQPQTWFREGPMVSQSLMLSEFMGGERKKESAQKCVTRWQYGWVPQESQIIRILACPLCSDETTEERNFLCDTACWKDAQAHHSSIPVILHGAPGAIHNQESEFYSPLLPPAPLAAKFLHWPYANPARPRCPPLLSSTQNSIELFFLQDSTENITFCPLLTVLSHKGNYSCPLRGVLQARSTCLHPIRGSALSPWMGHQIITGCSLSPQALSQQQTPPSVSFSSIQSAQRCTQHHPLIGPLQLPGSCIPCRWGWVTGV